MRRWFYPAFALLLTLSLPGCGGGAYAKHEALAKEAIQVLNDLGDALDSVKDKESAKEAAKKINTVCDRMVDVGKRAEALPKITKSDNDKLEKNFKPEMEKAMTRLMASAKQAGAKSQGDPDFVASLQRLGQVGESLQKIGK